MPVPAIPNAATGCNACCSTCCLRRYCCLWPLPSPPPCLPFPFEESLPRGPVLILLWEEGKRRGKRGEEGERGGGEGRGRGERRRGRSTGGAHPLASLSLSLCPSCQASSPSNQVPPGLPLCPCWNCTLPWSPTPLSRALSPSRFVPAPLPLSASLSSLSSPPPSHLSLSPCLWASCLPLPLLASGPPASLRDAGFRR